jgi:hypothetical protein
MATISVDLTDLELACGQIHDFYFSNYDKHKFYSSTEWGNVNYDPLDKSYRPSALMTYSQAKVSRRTIKFNNTGDRLYFVLVPSNYPDTTVVSSFSGYHPNGIRNGGLNPLFEYQYIPGVVSLTVPWDITTIDLSTLGVYRPGSTPYDAYINTDRSLGTLVLSPSDDGNLMRTISGAYERQTPSGNTVVTRGLLGITDIDPNTSANGWNQFNAELTRYDMGGFGTIPTFTDIYHIYDMFIAPTALSAADAYEWMNNESVKFNKIFIAATQIAYPNGPSSNVGLYEITDRSFDSTTYQYTGYTPDWYLDGGTGYPEKAINSLGLTTLGQSHFAFANDGMKLFTPKFVIDCDSRYAARTYSINTTDSYDINGGVPDKLTNNYDQGFTVSPDGSTIFFFENTDVQNNHGTLWAYSKNPIYVPDSGGGSTIGGGSGNASNFGFQVFDANGVKRFDSLDVTWNQVAFYQVAASQNSSFNIPNIAGKAVAVGQIMVNPQIFTRKAIAAQITVTGTTVSVTNHTEDIYVIVLVKG